MFKFLAGHQHKGAVVFAAHREMLEIPVSNNISLQVLGVLFSAILTGLRDLEGFRLLFVVGNALLGHLVDIF